MNGRAPLLVGPDMFDFGNDHFVQVAFLFSVPVFQDFRVQKIRFAHFSLIELLAFQSHACLFVSDAIGFRKYRFQSAFLYLIQVPTRF